MRSVIPALATASLLGVAPGATAIETTADTVTVLVVSHGCQSGLVIPATVIDDAWPARRDFPDAEHFEACWDGLITRPVIRGFVPACSRRYGPAPARRAVQCNAMQCSAVQCSAVQRCAARRRNNSPTPMSTLHISRDGARRITAALAASNARDAEGLPKPSLYGRGRVYGSVERFHLFVTCNVWIAARLRDTGVAVRLALALTAGTPVGSRRRGHPQHAGRHGAAPAAQGGPGGRRTAAGVTSYAAPGLDDSFECEWGLGVPTAQRAETDVAPPSQQRGSPRIRRLAAQCRRHTRHRYDPAGGLRPAPEPAYGAGADHVLRDWRRGRRAQLRGAARRRPGRRGGSAGALAMSWINNLVRPGSSAACRRSRSCWCCSACSAASRPSG